MKFGVLKYYCLLVAVLIAPIITNVIAIAKEVEKKETKRKMFVFI